MLKAQFQVLKAAARAEHKTHDYRQEFLANLIEAAESKGDNDKAKTIRSIKRAEQMSLLWQQVSAMKTEEVFPVSKFLQTPSKIPNNA